MRVRLVRQCAEKLSERFGELKVRVDEKLIGIDDVWNRLEGEFRRHFDLDFDRLIEGRTDRSSRLTERSDDLDLNDAFLLFEQWIEQTEGELRQLEVPPEDRLLRLQEEIRSRNPRLASLIDICRRLEGQSEPIPWQEVSELQRRWHQLWIQSLEIQCQLEERRRVSVAMSNASPTGERGVVCFISRER